MYVTVEDKAGKKKTAVHPDPAATNVRNWTEWQIAYADLAGVNLAAVKKLTIGVGDGKAGGAGKLFIDDIQFGKPIPSVGLLASYSFENDVKDGSGNGLDGALVGAPAFVTGKIGSALKFNGTSDGVDLGDRPEFNVAGSLSLSVWANIEAWGTNWGHVMVSNRGESGIGWQLRRYSSNKICFTTRGVGSDDTASILDAPRNEWVHIAGVYDNVANTKVIYINGVRDVLQITNAGKVGAAKHNVYIGCRANAANTGRETYFTGLLDEIKIYDIALTPAEVLKLAGK
jgi:arabinan endo-1,5-alpha-L-arabinosidase